MAQVLTGRERRHHRIRKKMLGTIERPRLSVFRSLKHLTVQVINDVENKTLLNCSTLSKEFRKTKASGGNIKAAEQLGKICAEAMKKKGIEKIVFDRGGYLYHGRVKALADALREGGVQF